jgi:hypothetical protein
MTPQDNTPHEEWYPYKPLDALRKQIRVLQVKPGTSDGLVECSVRHISLLDEPVPKYEAVSYVWSLVKGSACIVLDGNTINVPAAAEEVLRNFRGPDKERVLWIDAICINQRDLDERGHQVALMGEVYTKTAHTLVWLGKADKWTSKAFESLEVIYRQVLEETDNCGKLRKVLYGSTNIFQYSTADLPKGLDFTAVRAIFRRPWFCRRWVIQESALAPKGVVYCGDLSMDMLQLFRAAVWMQHKQHKLPFDLDAEGGMLNASYMSAYIDHDEGWFSARYGQQVYLADLFRYFRTFDVTDSRDCVYALLGLSRWASRSEPLPAFLTPDYRKPLGEILRDATKMAIYESGDLWLFRYIEHGYELTSPALQRMATPSWVPSLFRRPDPKTEPNHMRSAFRANLGMGETGQRIVGKEAGSSAGTDADVLSVQGLVVDSVNAIGSVFRPEHFDDVEGIRAIVHKVLICRSLKGGHANEALARLSLLDLGLVIVGGSCFDPQPTQGDMDQGDIFAQFLQDISKISGESQDSENDYDFAKLKSTLENPTFSRCVWAIKYACLNRRLFTTANGNVGLGPQAIREGDSLCILSDSRLPIMLRQSDTEWNVIGPCFVYGVMHGEAVKERLQSGDAIINFDLR